MALQFNHNIAFKLDMIEKEIHIEVLIVHF